LDRFNEEQNWVEVFLSRAIPSTSRAKSTTIRGIVNGIHSAWAYKTLEASVDGIIDLKLQETDKGVRNLLRIRSLRNVSFDSEWRPLSIDANEVKVEK
jgi:KaiC/GvpD/RAD55 family RecA-like ATPase